MELERGARSVKSTATLSRTWLKAKAGEKVGVCLDFLWRENEEVKNSDN
jgi:hypothetical protein